MFHYTLPRFGIKVRFVKSNDLAALDEAITSKTKAIYAESIGNPKLDVADLEGIAAVAHRHGIVFVLDNTVSPYILRPFDFGADVIVYSATKFIGGHGTSLGGLIVDSGKFDWINGRYPLIAARSAYHGLDFCPGAQARRQYRLHHECPRRSFARSGAGAFAVQRFSSAARIRNAPSADGAAL